MVPHLFSFHRPQFVPVVRLLAVLMLYFAVFCSSAHAIQENFSVGDQVKMKYLGKTVKGKVTGFSPLNWPEVEFKFNGKTRVRPFQSKSLTKIGGTSSGKSVSPSNRSSSTGEQNPFADPPQNAPMESTAEMRTWTDATGRFSVEAILLKQTETDVELEKDDGRVITLPIEKLSDPDKDYLEQLKLNNSSENPFAGGERNPFAGGVNRNDTKSKEISAGEPKSSGGLMNPTAPELNANELVLSESDWSVTPDAAQIVAPSKRVLRTEKSLSTKPFHSRFSTFTLTANREFAVGSATNPFDDYSELVTFDLKNNKAKRNVKIPIKECGVLSLTPSGTKVATYKKGWGSDPGRLDLWQVKGKTLTQTQAWKTAGFHDRNGFAPNRAVFLDENRLVTFGRRLVLWDCNDQSSTYSYSMDGPSALSPNLKQAAIVSGQNSIWIIQINDGEVLGKIELEEGRVDGLAFSPNGQWLAGYESGSGAVSIWDLNDGTRSRQMATPGGRATSIQWVGNRHVLMNQQFLMDVNLRATVWKYQMRGGALLSSPDGRAWVVSKERLTPVSLPNKRLDQLDGQYEPEELLVLKPGVKVGLQLELPFGRAENDQIRDHLESQLKSIGVEVASSANLQIKAIVKREKSQSTEMSSFTDPFGRRGTQKVTYTPNTSRIMLVRGDKTLWQKSTAHTVAGILSLKRNETVQQAAARVCKPTPNFFKSIKLPGYMAFLPPEDPPGESVITAQGIQ